MRNIAPHRFIKYRFVLLAAAIISWLALFLVLLNLKDHPTFPTSQVAGILGILFVWCNGIYWWLELCYPHIETLKNEYKSRSELASGQLFGGFKTVMFGYFIAGIFITLACIRVGFFMKL